MRRKWQRSVPLLAVCVATLVTGTAVAITLLAPRLPTPRAGGPGAAVQLNGPCLLGILGDCPRPTPPSPSWTTPEPTHSATDTPSQHPSATSSHRPTRHHSAQPSHRSRTTAPGQVNSPGGSPRETETRSHPAAATTGADPTPAGTTLSASYQPPGATPDRGQRVDRSGVSRSITQFLPIAAIFLAVGVVVAASAARRGSRRSRGYTGRSRRQHHRHAYSDTDELVQTGALRRELRPTSRP